MQNDSVKIGFTTMKRWLENRNSGKTFTEYIAAHNWKTVGIYGAGEVGQILYNEIKHDIAVRYFVDINAETYGAIGDVPVILPQDLSKQSKCDIVINTVMSDFDAISATILKAHPSQAIIAVRDAVYEF